MALVDVKQEGAVAWLTLNRPEALNALNEQLLLELRSALVQLESVKVVILTGAGEKAFVAGADIKAMSEMNPAQARAFAELGQGVIQLIEQAPFVSVAAVNGFAQGGGLELAMACDLVYASDKAKLGAPETNLGIIPGFGGTVNLARRAGFSAAMELTLSGDLISAEEAHRMGIINAIFPASALQEEVRKRTDKLSQKGIYSLLAARRMIRASSDFDHDRMLLLERETFSNLFATGEPKEGMSAFLEKRSPQF